FDSASTAPVIHQDWRRHFVPVPGVVRMILVIAFDLPCRNINRDSRSCIEVVARPLIANPGAAITGSPIGQIRVRIVVSCDPDGSAAGSPLVAFRPGVASRFSRCGAGERPPELLSRIRIVSRNEAADPELTAGRTNHDFSGSGERR